METTSIAEQPNQLSKSVDVAVKFLGDFAVLPGSSELMNGRLGSGLAHAALGIAGRAFLGPIGWYAVAANSFTKAVSNENIWTHVSGATKSMQSNREEGKVKDVVGMIEAARAKDEADRTESEKAILAAASD